MTEFSYRRVATAVVGMFAMGFLMIDLPIPLNEAPAAMLWFVSGVLAENADRTEAQSDD